MTPYTQVKHFSLAVSILAGLPTMFYLLALCFVRFLTGTLSNAATALRNRLLRATSLKPEPHHW